MNRSRFASVLAPFAVVLAACGGAAESAAPAKNASPPREEAPAPEPTTVEEAQKQIARAESELNGRALRSDKDDSKPKPAEPAPTAGSESKAQDYHSGATDDRCQSPCRALASMKRAVEALCRMTGETDTKCVDARKTLADNVGKTASCNCSS